MSDLLSRLRQLPPERRALLERLRRESSRSASSERIIPKQTARDRFALSFAQERLWFLEQLDPGGSHYNVAAPLYLRGPLDVDALAAALDSVSAAQELLRARVVVEDGEPLLRIASARARSLPLVDLQGCADPVAEGRRLAEQEMARPLALDRQLWRAQLLRLSPESHVLLLTMHHLICDHASVAILFDAVTTSYAACTSGRPAVTPAPRVQYGDFATWQRARLDQTRRAAELEFWRTNLSDAASLELPTTDAAFGGPGRPAALPLTIDEDGVQALDALAHAERASRFMVLLTALQAVLHRHTGQRDLIIGTPMASRGLAECERTIGPFVNLLPLRVRIDGEPTFRQLLARTRTSCLAAYAHAELPFDAIVQHLGRSTTAAPLIRASLVVYEARATNSQAGALKLAPFDLPAPVLHQPLELAYWPEGAALSGLFVYDAARFAFGRAELLRDRLQRLLRAALTSPDMPLADLTLVDTAERAADESRALGAAAADDCEETAYTLFARQATATPDAVALIDGDARLTYGRLHARVVAIAGALATRVAAGEVVAIHGGHSSETIAALLAVRRLGAAYLALDPTYPRSRLQAMMADAGTKLLLVERRHAHALSLDGVSRLVIEELDGQARTAPTPYADQVAYIMFTSGSSGAPKAVMASERALLNRCRWMWGTAPFVANEVMCQKTALSFVDSVWEIFGGLLRGVPTLLIETDASDPERLVALLARERVSRIVVVPALLRTLLELYPDLGERLPQLLRWTSSGERLPAALAHDFKHALPRAELLNLYGCSEVAADATAYVVRGDEIDDIAIGRPIAQVSARLLVDERPALPGMHGELCIGGGALAHGYLGRPDLTAARFVPDPTRAGARLYRTGDVAQWRDGQLHYLGRNDDQLKLRGVRIEPAEIEAALRRHPDVRDAAVVANEAAGTSQLVAYVVRAAPRAAMASARGLDVGLFFFGARDRRGERDKYRMVLDAAKVADQQRLSSVWLPERHFHEVAGLFPNPAVLAAALAMQTTHLQLRAGSVVLPLHDPLRVAEEWSVVDNLSGGRVGVSFTSGWVPNDFAFFPERFADKRALMLAGLEKVQALWRGERISARDGLGNATELRIFPAPVQTTLPCWLTCSGDPALFERAGQLGVNVLTGLLGQSLEQAAERIALYRRARAAAGHDPDAGRVTLILHTFLDDDHDRALQRVRAPLAEYMRSHVSLIETLLRSFELQVGVDDEAGRQALIEFALERYLRTASLIGRPEHCLPLLERVKAMGVDEVACLVDFGLRDDEVIAGVTRLAQLRDLAAPLGRQPQIEPFDSFLRSLLPAPMVPTRFVEVEALPRTPSGKLDRRTLTQRPLAATSHELPVGDHEQRIARHWEALLGQSPIGRHDNFFALGGHSLLAARLILRLRVELGRELPVRALFDHPTVAAFVTAVMTPAASERATPAAAESLPLLPPDVARRNEPFPLNDMQQAYFVGRSGSLAQGDVSIHSYRELERQGLDLARFTRAWRRLVDRHDALRTIVQTDGRQQILADVPAYDIAIIELCGQPVEAQRRTLDALRQRMSHQVHPLDQWPPFELVATRSDEGLRLHLSLDAIAIDGWSQRLLFRDLVRLYREDAPLPPLALSFRDYVLAERALVGDVGHQRALAYWRERLPTLPGPPTLPRSERHGDGTTEFVTRSARFAPAVGHALAGAAAAAGITLPALLLSAYARVLAAFSDQPTLTINVPLFNRLPLHHEVDDLVGTFSSFTLVSFTDDGAPLTVCAGRIQDELLAGIEHQRIGGVRIARELQELRPGAAFPVVFTSLDFGSSARDFGSTGSDGFDIVHSVGQTPQVWLDNQVTFGDDGELGVQWDAVDALFPPRLVADMFASYCALVESLAQPAAWQSTEAPLPPAQRDERERANATAAPLSAQTLADLLRESAAAHAPRAALIAGDLTLSYAELFARAEQLAAHLRTAGVGPERTVAIALRRGWQQAVATLAVALAGGAYVPLDPELPTARWQHVLAGMPPMLALSERDVAERVSWPEGWTRLLLDHDNATTSATHATSPSHAASPHDLAYVLHTSGSTGRPKGVMIEQRSVVNRVLDINRRFAIGPDDRMLGVTSLQHDLSVYDLFGTFAAGAALVLPEAARAHDPAHWHELVQRHRVTVWNSVPAFMQLFASQLENEAPEPTATSLRLLLLAGDVISVALAQRLAKRLPEARLISLGGPTETTVWDIFHPVNSDDRYAKRIPYGRPLSNANYHVFDEQLRDRPRYLAGELYIGGVGLARGYWNDDAQTASRFVHHPRTGERLYRSGDRGRYIADGELEILGRVDHQIKINGQRIECGEIEQALLQHPAVSEVVVSAETLEAGTIRLVAHVVARQEPPADDARAALEKLEFRLAQPGLRREPQAHRRALPQLGGDDKAMQVYLARRSYRRFAPRPMSVEELGALLEPLRQLVLPGHPLPKYRYASAGNLYPVQTYVWIRPGRVTSWAPGAYYYDPQAHQLVLLSDGAQVPLDAHGPANRESFAASALSIFLVAQMAAATPIYGDTATRYAALEAGLMAQLLETTAPAAGIGLCQIGGLDARGLREGMRLGDTHQLLHTLIAGPVDRAAPFSLDAFYRDAAGAESAPVEPRSATRPLIDELRTFLTRMLPAGMVPAHFVMLPALPRNASGKVDRSALPTVGLAERDTALDLPADELQAAVADIWRQLLGRPVGVHDGFFAAGGDSLRAIQVTNRLRDAFGVQIGLADFLAEPTVAGLARRIEEQLADDVLAEAMNPRSTEER